MTRDDDDELRLVLAVVITLGLIVWALAVVGALHLFELLTG